MRLSMQWLTVVFLFNWGLPLAFAIEPTPLLSDGLGEIAFTQTIKDFGAVLRGEQLEVNFPFRNVGSGPLVIHGVHSACGCTAVAAEAGKVYAPGETGQIQVNFDTKNFSGLVAKMVTVMTNEKLLPSRTLTVKVLVQDELVATPPVLNFGAVRPRSLSSLKVLVKAVGSLAKLEVKAVEYNSAKLQVSQKQDGNVLTLIVSLKPDLGVGYLKEAIVVKTTAKANPELLVLVRAEVVGNIYHQPQYVEFGAIKPQAVAVKALNLAGQSRFAITGSKVELTINGQAVAIPENQVSYRDLSGNEADKVIELALKNLGPQAGSVHGKLVLLTSDPLQPELGVDFYGFFRE